MNEIPSGGNDFPQSDDGTRENRTNKRANERKRKIFKFFHGKSWQHNITFCCMLYIRSFQPQDLILYMRLNETAAGALGLSGVFGKQKDMPQLLRI